MAITGASTQNGTTPCTAGTWTYTPTTALSADGTYSITVTQTDTAGNTGTTGAQTINVDRTLPIVSLTSVNGTARTFPLSLNVNATSVGGACGTVSGSRPRVCAVDERTCGISTTGRSDGCGSSRTAR